MAGLESNLSKNEVIVYKAKYKITKIAGAILLSLSISIADTEFTKIDLGTLQADNSGDSRATAVSADGRVVVGYADTESGSYQAFRHDAAMTGLGTLRTDNSGYSEATAVSADGRVVVGEADTESGFRQAFRHDAAMTGLGTLRTDNSGNSRATAVSADGRVVVGYADTESGSYQAFRHDAAMTGLGTLRTDNSGNSVATAVSANGRVVVGYAETESGSYQAFRHDAAMTGLGTLRTDNSGNSSATAVSADGRVVVGEAETDSGSYQAFRHDAAMTGLGTLRTDNSGNSVANAVSADGRVVVGYADTESGSYQAFRHDAAMTGLGTLRTDNSGNSVATAVSADGRVVVGEAETESGSYQAFRHHEGDAAMTGLGTLRTDNSGDSSATAVSADGRVVVGESTTDNMEVHAAVWRIITPEPIDPEPPKVVIVDATNSNQTMRDAAKKTYQVLDLYRSRLMSLSDTECSLDNYYYCIGVFTNYDGVKSNHTFTTGFFGALRLDPQWSLGLSVDYLADSSLPNGFKTRGSSTPGIGVFVNFQQSSDLTGFNIKLSGAYQEDKISIRRQQLSKTEAGEGDTSIKGHLLKLDMAYGFNTTESSMVFPHVGIFHTQTSREAYTESRNAYFPAVYGEASDKRTNLVLGLKVKYNASKAITLTGDVGAYISLDHKRKNFTGSIDYIGSHVYDFGNEKKVQPYVSLGIQGTISDNSAINLRTRWSKQGYDNDSFNVGLSYSYRF